MSTTAITAGLDHLTIRVAGYGDRGALIALAQRDSSELPDGPLLVGEAGGRIVAAVAVVNGRTIADPFSSTADLVALLHARADQIGRARRRELHVVARSAPAPRSLRQQAA